MSLPGKPLVGNLWELVGREAQRGSERSFNLGLGWGDTLLFAVVVILSLSYYSNTCSLSLEKIIDI